MKEYFTATSEESMKLFIIAIFFFTVGYLTRAFYAWTLSLI